MFILPNEFNLTSHTQINTLKQEISIMQLGIVGNLSPEQLADLIAYLKWLQ